MEDFRLEGLAEVARAEVLVIRSLESGPKSGDQIRRSVPLATQTVCKVLTRLRTAGVIDATKRPDRRGCLYRIAPVRKRP